MHGSATTCIECGSTSAQKKARSKRTRANPARATRCSCASARAGPCGLPTESLRFRIERGRVVRGGRLAPEGVAGNAEAAVARVERFGFFVWRTLAEHQSILERGI